MDLVVTVAMFLMTVVAWVFPILLVAVGIWAIATGAGLTIDWRRRGVRWIGVFAVLFGLFVLALDLGLIH